MDAEYKAGAFCSGFRDGWEAWHDRSASPTHGRDDSSHPYDHGYYVGWNRAHLAALDGADPERDGWTEYNEEALESFLNP